MLILFGFSGAGMIAALEEYRWIFMIVTFGFLGAAFYLTYRPRYAAGESTEDCGAPAPGRRLNMMTLNKVMLWAVTVMAVVFLFFPQVVTGLFAPGGELTAEMQQTVIQVEGMTCPG